MRNRRPPFARLGDLELLAFDPLELRDELTSAAAERFERDDVEGGIAALERLRFATIDEATLARTDGHLRRLARGRRIVATCDPLRLPAADEVVVVYGNYPHLFCNVVVNNPIKRHVATFGSLPHDVVEFDQRWDGIDRIFVINADERTDRLDAVLRELAAARAPFDRVERIPAVRSRLTGVAAVDGAIGCLESHLAALLLAARRGCRHALVLEDDFSFTSDLEIHLDDLSAFIARDDDYVVCLLATSKHGRVVPRDDLVSESRQACTNASGYLASGARLQRLIAVQEEALELLKTTRDPFRYAADRYWTQLQRTPGGFLVFRRKLGFQAASFSDIEREISRYLD